MNTRLTVTHGSSPGCVIHSDLCDRRLLIHLLMKALHESFVSASPLPTWMGGDNEYACQRPGISPALWGQSKSCCVSDCQSRGFEFDPGPVPYFRQGWHDILTRVNPPHKTGVGQ